VCCGQRRDVYVVLRATAADTAVASPISTVCRD